MAIKQKTIETKATFQNIAIFQGSPDLQDLELKSLANIEGSGKYEADQATTGEYFLIFSDSPDITEQILVAQNTSPEFFGSEELAPTIDETYVTATYKIRKFYISRILKDGESVETNYIGEVYEGVGGPVQSIKNLDQIEFGEFKFADNDYTQINLAGVFQPEYTKDTYLILSKIEEETESEIEEETEPPKQVQASPFENLCDIILAETIKSYLL